MTDANFNNSMVSPKVVQYWTDMLQPLVNGGAYALGAQNTGCSPTTPSTTNPVLALFDLFCGNAGVETTALTALDLPNSVSGFPITGIPDGSGLPCGGAGQPLCQYLIKGTPNAFYNPQYVSLYTLRSIGFSNYNALQASLRHQMSHGIQFDFNYTSRSQSTFARMPSVSEVSAFSISVAAVRYLTLGRPISSARFLILIPPIKSMLTGSSTCLSGKDAPLPTTSVAHLTLSSVAGSCRASSGGQAVSRTPFTTIQLIILPSGSGKVPQSRRCPMSKAGPTI